MTVRLRTKESLVLFPVRAHAWVVGVVGQVPTGGTWEATTHWCFSPSHSSSLPFCLKVNKYYLKKKKTFKNWKEKKTKNPIAKDMKRYLEKRDIKMTLKHMKSHWTLLIIKRNLHWTIASHLSGLQKFKSLIIYFLSKAVGR